MITVKECLFFGMLKLVILGAFCYATASSAGIEQVDDSDLVHLLTHEDSLVVLFTKSNCPECTELETVIDNIKSELTESLGTTVIKAHNSQLTSIYDPTREPSLIYFRKGIPLLYHGSNDEFEIMQNFGNNKEPVVKELSDINFEHLTQASTGATTGDWFVFFYSADCVLCQRLYAVWEAVGANLRNRLNVARVNRLEAGVSTAKRFGIVESPEFIYIRQGKVYRYTVKKYTPKDFIEFVENGFRKQTHPESVPAVSNDIGTQLFSSFIHLANNFDYLVYICIALVFAISVYLLCKSVSYRKQKPSAQQSAKSKQQ